MIFAILGGDTRSAHLMDLLRRDGHEVRAFALEKAVDGCTETAAAAVSGAACIVLPLPCARDGRLNAPLSAAEHTFESLLSAAGTETAVCAGRATEELCAICAARGLALHDYFQNESFTLKNAALTAEGALGILLAQPWALRGSRVLVCGFGRIGRMLAGMLVPLGCEVTVAARRADARTQAVLSGCRAILPQQAAEGAWDAVVNTVPSTLFGPQMLRSFGDACLIELASPPYGFDFQAAQALGKEIVLASGLPGKCAPQAAAQAVKETVYEIMEESAWKNCGSGWR